MIHTMREIEVKAKLKDEARFLKASEKLNIVFGKSFKQSDITFLNGTPVDDPNWNIFRIREEKEQIILTMKYKASSRARDNHEYETVIGNADEVKKILLRLGYKFDVQIKKDRRIAHFKDLELCIDTVQKELWELLEQLGIHSKDRVYKGYDSLMRELT
jgi:predicted adenylyl cyclase CyaB